MIAVEIHLAAPGSAKTPGRTLSAQNFNRIVRALERAQGVTLVHAFHNEAGASAEFVAEVATWDRAAVLAAARSLFDRTDLRGSIAAHYEGRTFFQLATPGGTADLAWEEDGVPVVPSTLTGTEART